MSNPETTTVWILDAADPATGRIVASFRTVNREDLPIDGWVSQGLVERAPHRLTVPAGSSDAESAAANSRLISV